MATIKEARRRLAEASSEDLAPWARTYLTARNNLARLSNGSTREVVALLNFLSRELRGRLTPFLALTGDSFEQAAQPLIVAEIRRALASFQAGATAAVGGGLSDAFSVGARVTAQALNSVGVPAPFPVVSPSVIDAALGATGNLFTEMTDRLGARIITQVQAGATGIQSGTQALRNIERLLKTSEEVRRGLRRRIGFGFQAEAITRTEVGRVYSQAQQMAAEEISQSVPDLKKRWVVVKGARRGHREAEARYKVGGSQGPIPVKDRFLIRDYSRTGSTNYLTIGGRVRPGRAQRVARVARYTRGGRVITDRMLFPRDPEASAGNIVNCTCLVLEVLPEIEKSAERSAGVVMSGG